MPYCSVSDVGRRPSICVPLAALPRVALYSIGDVWIGERRPVIMAGCSVTLTSTGIADSGVGDATMCGELIWCGLIAGAPPRRRVRAAASPVEAENSGAVTIFDDDPTLDADQAKHLAWYRTTVYSVVFGGSVCQSSASWIAERLRPVPRRIREAASPQSVGTAPRSSSPRAICSRT